MVVNASKETEKDSDEDEKLTEFDQFEKLSDEEKDLLSRLHKFSFYFVEELETRLVTYHGILEGRLKSDEDFPENVAKILGSATGGVLFYLFGPGAKLPAKIVSGGAAKIGKFCAEKFRENRRTETKFNLVELIYGFRGNRKKGVKIFTKMAVEIFYAYEMQFFRATSEEGYRKAMRLLAQDAANRFLSCFIKEESCEIAIENVLRGESKKIIPYLPTQIASPGSKILCEYKDTKFEWNTCKIYEKSGIAVEDSGFKLYKSKKSKCLKYGYRRLFYTEELSDDFVLNEDLSDSNDWIPNFKGDASYYKKQAEIILNKMNKDERNIDETRMRIIIDEFKTDVLEEIRHIKENGIMEEKLLEALGKVEKSIVNNISIQQIADQIDLNQKDIVDHFNYAIKHREVIAVDVCDRLDTLERTIKGLSKRSSNRNSEKHPVIFRLMRPAKSFTGRIKELDRIREMFEKDLGVTVISQTASITGFGGVGKSELAKKYAEVHLDTGYYKNVMFISTQNRENVLDSFTTLARKMNVPLVEVVKDKQEDREIRSVIEDMYEILNDDNGKSLLIFDNAYNYNDIKEFLPKYYSSERKIHILITSRCQCWDVGELGKIEVVSLDTFTKEEAFDFVCKVLQDGNQPVYQSDAEINALTERFQYLPLALKQAAGYIKYQNSKRRPRAFTLQDYMKTFENKTEQLLKDGLYDNEDCQNQTVMVVWTIAVENIRRNEKFGELAVRVFHIMAYISPDHIGVEELFSSLEPDAKKLWDAVNLLHNYSLISLQNGVVSVHRLMQEVMRLHLKNNKSEERVLKDILKLLNRKSLIEHIISAWGHAIKYPKILKKYYPASFYGITKDTPLHILAMYDNNCDTIEFILQFFQFKNIDDRNAYYETALFRALHNGNVKVAKVLMMNSASSDVCSVSGMTPLHIAAFYGHNEIVAFIKEHWPDLIEVPDKIDRKPLDLAVLRGHVDIIKSLGGSSDRCEVYLFHARFQNMIKSQDHRGIVDLLNGLTDENRYLIETKLNSRTVLHLATVECDYFTVKTLLKSGASVDCTDENLCTPLHYTASMKELNYVSSKCDFEDNFLIMRMFLENGADANNINRRGDRPIYHALYKNNLKGLMMLLEYGADIYDRNKFGATPLTAAMMTNNEIATRILLEKGAFVNAKSAEDRKDAFYHAVRSNNSNIIRLFMEEGAVDLIDESVVSNMILDDRLDALRIMLEYKKDLFTTVSFRDLFFTATANANGNEDMLKFLLENKDEHEDYVNLAFCAAIERSFSLDFLSYAIEKGAALNDNRNPLKIAVRSGNVNTVKFLLEKGARSSKWPLIRISMMNGNLNMAALLARML